MRKGKKRPIFGLSLLTCLLLLGMGEVFSQPELMEDREPQIRLGEVVVKFREFESTPSPIKILELHIEIFNRSQNSVAPPDSIKLVVVPREMKFLSTDTTTELPQSQEEVTLNLPLPPRTGQMVIFGFPFPQEDPDAITFEIQVNPPEGEKKTFTWEKK